jgi:hypothetical protein
MLLDESLRGGVPPGVDEGLPDRQLIGVAEADDGRTPAPPSSTSLDSHGRYTG